MASPAGGRWSNGQFFGWALGSMIGTAIPTYWQSYIFTLLSAGEGFRNVFPLLCSFVGGGAGYGLAFLFDDQDDIDQWRAFKASFLASLIFSLLTATFLCFIALPSMREDTSPTALAIFAMIGFISGLIPAGVKGVMNNLTPISPGRRQFEVSIAIMIPTSVRRTARRFEVGRRA